MTWTSVLPFHSSTVLRSVWIRNPQNTICDSLPSPTGVLLPPCWSTYQYSSEWSTSQATKTIYLCLGIYSAWISLHFPSFLELHTGWRRTVPNRLSQYREWYGNREGGRWCMELDKRLFGSSFCCLCRNQHRTTKTELHASAAVVFEVETLPGSK